MLKGRRSITLELRKLTKSINETFYLVLYRLLYQVNNSGTCDVLN